MSEFHCRFCGTPLAETFCDLGTSPASNSFVAVDDAQRPEPFYSLKVYVCHACFLVQIPEHKASEEIFSTNYAYFSSYSDSWLAHAKAYCGMAVARFDLNAHSRIVELASNDGYLLQYFKAMGIPVLGIEPSANVAAAAEAKGIPTVVRFFGRALAAELSAQDRKADLLLGNNVLAHVPDINDFVAGLKIALKPAGVITMEFPHLMKLIEQVQFDTIYHEHYSYLSLGTVDRIFAHHGLSIFDVEELSTHGGSLRVYASHTDRPELSRSSSVASALARERAMGLADLAGYRGFDDRVRTIKSALLEFLIGAKRANKKIAAYGAAAKGNTLLNYCGVRTDFIDYVVDRNPAKQGTLLPGTRIPVLAPDTIDLRRPDYLLILPWNIRDEVIDVMSRIRQWNGKFVVPIPQLEVIA